MINDPNILLSVINTKLRDTYSSLEELCDDLNYEIYEVVDTLKNIGYIYDKDLNKFIFK